MILILKLGLNFGLNYFQKLSFWITKFLFVISKLDLIKFQKCEFYFHRIREFELNLWLRSVCLWILINFTFSQFSQVFLDYGIWLFISQFDLIPVFVFWYEVLVARFRDLFHMAQIVLWIYKFLAKIYFKLVLRVNWNSRINFTSSEFVCHEVLVHEVCDFLHELEFPGI